MRKTMKVSKDYLAWIADLKKRYKATQIKAAVAVNSTMIEFYWNLGKDISERYPGKKRGIDFFGKLSRDLLAEIPEATAGLSSANIRYAFRLYALYSYLPQLVEDKICSKSHRRQVADDRAEIAYRPQIVEEKFEPADLGQLLGYKVMVKHALNTTGDFEPIGLLVCKDHNRILAQYMMDELKTPLGITDYELKRILPPVEKLQEAVKECGEESAECCRGAARADATNAKVVD